MIDVQSYLKQFYLNFVDRRVILQIVKFSDSIFVVKKLRSGDSVICRNWTTEKNAWVSERESKKLVQKKSENESMHIH